MPNPENGVTIGSAARQTGVNIETIRYYERCGLLPPPRRSEGGRRLYDFDHIRRLRFIRRSRELGFPLREIERLLRLVETGDYTCREVKEVTLHHLDEVRTRIVDLKRMETALHHMAQQCEGDATDACPILDVLFAATDETLKTRPSGPPR